MIKILERVQNLISTVFCPHNEDKYDRFSQISSQFNHRDDDVREVAAENAMVEEPSKDNFLRGSLMDENRRRHSKTMNKIAVSYWRHGAGCSCCKESHRSEDFEKVAPTSMFNKGTTADLSRTGYINLNDNDRDTELHCLTSFITESGRHRVITQEFSDQVMEASASTEELKPVPIDDQELTQDLVPRKSAPTLQNLPALKANVVEMHQTTNRLGKLIQK